MNSRFALLCVLFFGFRLERSPRLGGRPVQPRAPGLGLSTKSTRDTGFRQIRRNTVESPLCATCARLWRMRHWSMASKGNLPL